MRDVTYSLPTWRLRFPRFLPHHTEIQDIRYDDAGKPYQITLRYHDHVWREVALKNQP